MQTLATKCAALLGATLLSAAIAGCGSSANSSANSPATTRAVDAAHDTQGMSMPSDVQAGHTASGPAMSGLTPLIAGANGTSASASGLTLKADAATVPTGRTTTVTLKVLAANGTPVTEFDVDQTKLMHLIVVRTDFTGYQHVHPVLGAAGRFTVPLLLPAAGSYRAIADFTTAGKRYALGLAITAPGTAIAVALPREQATAAVAGYQVHLQHGTLSSTAAAPLTFTVTRGGKPVTSLEPYLGAFGHLVALRKPDLAYSHVHPTGHDMGAATIVFDAEFPGPATYRLFLQFRAAGHVRTAPFTVKVNT